MLVESLDISRSDHRIAYGLRCAYRRFASGQRSILFRPLTEQIAESVYRQRPRELSCSRELLRLYRHLVPVGTVKGDEGDNATRCSRRGWGYSVQTGPSMQGAEEWWRWTTK